MCGDPGGDRGGRRASSAAVDLGGLRLAGDRDAGRLDGRAGLTFQAASSGSAALADLYSEAGAEVTVPAAAGRFIRLEGVVFGGLRWLKLSLRHGGHAGQPGGGTDVEAGAGGGGIERCGE